MKTRMGSGNTSFCCQIVVYEDGRYDIIYVYGRIKASNYIHDILETLFQALKILTHHSVLS